MVIARWLVGWMLVAGCDARASAAEPLRDAPSEASSSLKAGIVGTWVGYADGARFPSESDRVALTITEVKGDGQVVGTVAFGERGTLPPATDGNVGYPPGIEMFQRWRLFEQFAYTLTGTYDRALSRLEVSLQSNELWTEWCALQTPYANENGDYDCLPNCGFGRRPTGCMLNDCKQRPGPIDCGHLELCRRARVCRCEASGCTDRPGSQVTLDLHRDGKKLQGPIDGLGTAYLVRE